MLSVRLAAVFGADSISDALGPLVAWHIAGGIAWLIPVAVLLVAMQGRSGAAWRRAIWALPLGCAAIVAVIPSDDPETVEPEATLSFAAAGLALLIGCFYAALATALRVALTRNGTIREDPPAGATSA